MKRTHHSIAVLISFAVFLIFSAKSFADPDPAANVLEHPGVLRRILKGHTDDILCVAINKDGLVASGSLDRTTRIWNPVTGKELFSFQNKVEVQEVAFSANGKFLASAGPDGLINVWDVSTGKAVKTIDASFTPVSMLRLSEDGSILAAAGGPHGFAWNVQTGKVLSSFEGGFSLSPNGKIIATSLSDGGIQLMDVDTGKDTLKIKGHLGFARELQFSPDGKCLASGGADPNGIQGDPTDPKQDKLVKLWDVSTGKNLAVLSGHTNGIGHIMFSPDGKKIVSTDYNGCMKMWDLSTGQTVSTLEHVKAGDSMSRTPLGYWALAPDLKTWVVGAGTDILWIDITDFTGQ